MKNFYSTRICFGFLLVVFLIGLSGCAVFKNRSRTGGSGTAAGRGDRFALALRESLSASDYRDGIWEGTAPGYRGPLRVLIIIAAGQIQGIELDEHREDPAIGGAAMEELLDLVLEYNSADLDAISGATESSRGFLTAVEDALRTANVNSE
jgi:uncharacterized protein with FMN-binding domain